MSLLQSFSAFRGYRVVLGFLYAFTGAAGSELAFNHLLADTSAFAPVGRMVVVLITLYLLQRFSLGTLPPHRRRSRDLICLTLVLLASILFEWIGRIVGLSLSEYAHKSPYIDGISAASTYFALPYATGGILLQVVLGLRYGLVFAISFAVITSLYSPGQALVFPLVISTNLVACLSLSRVRSRSAYFRAGLYIGLVSMAFALSSLLMDGAGSTGDVLVRVLGACVSGILCTILSAGFTPVLEYVGGYVTDMRLIEMATLDHPLLKDLSVQAPGTWNHSMVMGMMAESAADAVGANTVLARVASYFHDVGKVKKPLYFVENQLNGENRHDKLSPSMSALIIRSHVKDGLELARKHKLPAVIQDMIAQHHGTSVIEYFYEKALKEAEAQGEVVDKGHYTYPGPRPQTREAGILMLADGIEAASRTLSEPSADRIQGMVQKMINKVFASGELNECDLSLSDLHLIAKCFTRVLTGIHHQRVAYSEPAEKVNVRDGVKDGGKEGKDGRDDGRKEVDRSSGGKGPAAPGEKDGVKAPGGDNLKRLGL